MLLGVSLGRLDLRETSVLSPSKTQNGCSLTDAASRLLRLSDLAQEVGADPLAEEAREFATRVSEGRFYEAGTPAIQSAIERLEWLRQEVSVLA